MSEILLKKKVKDLFKKIDKFYEKDNGVKMINWFDDIGKNIEVYISNNTVPGLLNNSKIQIETDSEEGIYNIILLWISININNEKKYLKLKEYDFSNFPSSKNINLSGKKNKLKYETKEDVERWLISPEKHPITDKNMSPMSEEYAKIYEKSYNIMKKTKPVTSDIEIKNIFPKKHLLFGNIDLLYYTYSIKNIVSIQNPKKLISSLLKGNIEATEEKNTVFETEIELLKNLFSKGDRWKKVNYTFISNLEIITDLINEHHDGMIYVLFSNFTPFIEGNLPDITYIKLHAGITESTEIINFLENNTLNNGKTVIDYLHSEQAKSIANNHGNYTDHWTNDIINLYEKYQILYSDIYNLLDPESRVITNYENKIFDNIDDPLDKYFKKYEDLLVKIKDPRYNKLIDLNTFEKIKENVFLNEDQYVDYLTNKEKVVKTYLKSKKEYEDIIEKNSNIVDITKRPKSPSPPKRPIIKLGNGSIYHYGSVDPIYIKNKLRLEFDNEYKKIKHLIDDYNKIKNMTYLQLIKHETKNSASKRIKDLTKENKIFSMNRQQINDEILYDPDYELEDKCSEPSDVISREEFNDDNYPLSKLQLMVQLKIYKENGKYRTECIYAPKLYNYLVNCINNKTPFINPITKTVYTEDNINSLMNIMKIVNPDIERPYFLEPMKDTGLKIDYRIIEYDPQADGWNKINFYEINIYRKFGPTTYRIYNICCIPADIEANGDYATESTDQTSSTMLFKIFKLFNDGRLLNRYIPPYFEVSDDGRIKQYIKLGIHFNNYKKIEQWFREIPYPYDPINVRTKKQFIDMFKHYSDEINTFIY